MFICSTFASWDATWPPFWPLLAPSWTNLCSYLGTILGSLRLSCLHLDAILRLVAADWLSFDANLSHIDSIHTLLSSIFKQILEGI